MKRLLAGIVIWLIIIAPLRAQDDAWESSCASDAEAVIAPIMGEALYAAGCEARNLCMSATELAPVGCEFPVYDALVSLCEGEACALQSRFYMATLLLLENPPKSLYVYSSSDIQMLQGRLADTLLAFQAGDYQTILDIYDEVTANWTYELTRPPLQDFIVGLMYEELGELEAAAAVYLTSIELIRMPFVTWQRAEVLLQLGYGDAAAAEALTMREYPALAAFLEEHPLPDELPEDWLVYRVSRRGVGGGGRSITDYIAVPGIPTKIVFLSNGSLLIMDAANLITAYEPSYVPEMALFYPDGDAYVRHDHWFRIATTLTFEAEIGRVTSAQEGVMGFLEGEALIAPADDVPDPRPGQGENCENGARWQLAIDGYGAASAIYGEEAPHYYDAPDGAIMGTFNVDLQTFRVVDGPLCIESQAWWEVDLLQDDGQTYWVAEAEAQSPDEFRGLYYYFIPINSPADN